VIIAETHVETLEKLGLTQLQAKIYLATLTLQRATAIRISTTANVARPDVYRIMPSLEELGLLKKLITTPTMFEATPLRNACQLLIRKKRDHYTQIQKESEELISQYAEKSYITTPDIVDEGFSIIASKELWQEKFAAIVKASQVSIYVIGEWMSLTSIALRNPEIYLDPLERGLTVKLITNRATDQHIIDVWNKQANKRFPSLDIQLINERPPINAMIFDDQTATMSVRSTPDIELTPILWSDNPEFVKVIGGYFEHLWAKAQNNASKKGYC
jgi:sugar-specific transcriptional regulator TrmB